MSAYRLVAISIILFITLSSVFVIVNYKDLSMAIPAKLENKLPVTPFEGWREFTSKQGGFSVKVPAIPQNAQDTVRDYRTGENLLYDMYVSEKWNGAIFMVTVVNYPKKIEDSGNTLKDFLGNMLSSNAGNELVSAKESSFVGKTSLNFKIKNPNNNIEGVTFADGNRIYFITYITEEHNRDQKDFEYFLGSFKLI